MKVSIGFWGTIIAICSFLLIRSSFAISLAPPSYYVTGSDPQKVFCTDIDGDGDIDLVVADNGIGSVTLVKNNGDDTFSNWSPIVVGQSPYSVFCADLDGDLDMDIVVAVCLDGNNVAVLRNNGDGTFQSPVHYVAGADPYDVFCSDLDGDLDMDIAVANCSGGLSILKNNGNGTFQSAVNYAAGTNPLSLYCADLDGDSDKDIVLANFNSSNFSVFRNNGDGTFQSAVNYATEVNPVSVFCANLDGDLDMDVAITTNGASAISVFKNNGDGTFQPAVNYPAGINPHSVFCADLDGDSDIDMAVANSAFDVTISILENNGDGTFKPKVDYETGYWPSSIFCADMNGDMKKDIVVTEYLHGGCSIFKNITPSNTLVGYWKFDEGSGTIANDSSIYGNHGTLLNGSGWADGITGTALNLDGTDDQVMVPDASSLDIAGSFTISAWIYPRDLPSSYRSFVNKYFNYVLQTDGSGLKRLRCVFSGSDGYMHGVESEDNTLESNRWQHVVGVWDGNAVKVYKNGVEVGSNPQSGIVPNVSNEPLYIGSEQGSYQFFNGLIDEVKIYNRALAASEIEAEFETGLKRGDANGDGNISVGDAVYIVSYIFRGGPAPKPVLAAGDANCDGKVTVGDAVYIVSYIFRGGPAPACN